MKTSRIPLVFSSVMIESQKLKPEKAESGGSSGLRRR